MTISPAAALLVLAVASASAFASSSMDDRFDGTSVDACRWEDVSHGGLVAQQDALALTTPGASAYENARLMSQSRLVGDFDIQVHYQRTAGFAAAPASPPNGFAQLSVALGLWWDDGRYMQLTRLRHSSGDVVNAYSSLPGGATSIPWLDQVGDAGTLRIVRTGTRVTFLHATSGDFVALGSLDIPASPVFVYLDVSNIDVARGVQARFDEFVVNHGANDDVVWTQPTFYSKRPAFALGGVSENWPALRYFGNVFGTFDPLAAFRSNGMEWMRASVTTRSAPELDYTPTAQWRTLPFKDHYWGSREYAARTLRDAADHGMRLYAYLYFSDSAANWGNQPAPAAWAGKSIAETAALMEQHAYETAMYFKQQNLDVEIYELGNEIDAGIVDFVPYRRIAVPPGVNFVDNRAWLRDNVWSVEATLLKSAIAGIRRANPSARVALHAASISSGTGPQFGPEFFQAMRDFGVDYDIAALSLPYAQSAGNWKLQNYSKACWFRRLARTIDQIAVPGKPVMIVEASYQASPVTLPNAAMPDFPFSPQGQAAWARENFRFASNHASVIGWFWFYPEFWANVTDVANEAYVLQFGSLMSSGTDVRPALQEFRANLDAPSANTVEYFHAGFGHYFMTADPAEIAGLDGGAFGGAWQRTGKSFMTHANPTAGTVPVCRFFTTPGTFGAKSSHFYTADPAECAGLKSNPNWQYEKIAFHAPLPDAAGSCRPGTSPVFRMYNSGQTGAPNHRFTTDANLRQDFLGNRGFVQEGVGPLGVSMCAPD